MDSETISAAVGLSVSIFVAGFLCTQYLSHVLTLDALATFLTTTWVALFARDCLTQITPDSPVDALHEYLLLLVAFAMLAPALVWFLSTDTTDVTIRTALALSRTVGFGLASAVIVYHQSGEQFQNYQYIFLSMATLALVYAVQLIYSSTVNTMVRGSNLNSHLNADFSLAMLCGLICLSVPDIPASLFGQELDDLHTFLYRLFGAMTLGFACLPAFGPKFRTATNKRAVLFSRALSMLATLLVTFSKYRQGDIPEGTGSTIMISILLLLTLPSAVGCMRYDQGSGLELPWRGLRVPDVAVGGVSPEKMLKNAKKEMKKKTAKTRRSSKRQASRGRRVRRGRSRSRRRRKY